MRKILVSNYVSLDGFIAGPNGEIDWFVWDKETEDYAKEMVASVDTILFGRLTYDMMADYWPTADSSTDDPVIIDVMNNSRKIVISQSLDKVEWNNSELLKENVIEKISEMKRQSGQDMVIFGSGSIVSLLTRSGLIDDYRILVNPIVLGSGKSMFNALNERLKMKLVNTKVFQCGVVLLQYVPENLL